MRRFSINPPLAVSLGFGVVAAVVVLAQVPGLLGAVFIAGLREDPTKTKLMEYLDAHQADLALYQDRFNGRSLFFRPKRPPGPTRRSVQPPSTNIVEKGPDLPTPPRAATIYKGPGILFVLGDEVWFDSTRKSGPDPGKRLRLRVGEAGDGVSVIASDPPWTVTLGYDGWEGEVPIFERDVKGLETTLPSVRRRSIPGLEIVEANDQDDTETERKRQ